MKIKNFSDILSRLIDLTLINTNEINDFSPGSVILSIYEAIAMELFQIEMILQEGALWAIDHSIMEAFDFRRRKARRAYGDVVIEFHTALQKDMLVPQGTSFHSNIRGYNQEFELVEDYRVEKGSSKVVVTAYCTEAGKQGNIPANALNMSGANIFNVKKTYNPKDILTGRDQESLEQVKRRFRSFVETRGRATNKALRYGTRQVEDVTGVYVHETTGYVEVYAHDGNGELSEDLKREIEIELEEYRPTGIKMVVKPIEKTSVDVGLFVILRDVDRYTESFEEEVVNTIRDFINEHEASEDLIISNLVTTIMNIDRDNIYDILLAGPTKNVRVKKNELLRAGEVSVNLKVHNRDNTTEAEGYDTDLGYVVQNSAGEWVQLKYMTLEDEALIRFANKDYGEGAND